jgi:hypothetical protein
VQSKIPVGLLICFEGGLATPTPCSILLLINFLGHTARTFFEVAEQERKRPNREAPPKEETKQKQVDQNLLSKLWGARQISLRGNQPTTESGPNDSQKTRRPSGATISRKGARLTRKKPPEPRERFKRLLFHQGCWEMALDGLEPHALRKRLPSTYSYLFRFDRKWLDQHRPPRPESKPRKPRMDWQARDRELVENIREIVLWNPKSLTRGKLLAELRIGNMLRRNPDELKRTREEIRKSMLYLTR